jgi:hypothetical protein
MDTSLLIGLVLILCLLILATLLFLALRAFQLILRDKKEVELSQIALLSKTVNLLSVKDPLAYQAVAVMDQVSQFEPETVEEDIDSLLARAEAGDKMTEAENERIDRANFSS